jgi:3-oxo-5-alpha-steroid 4-dehydrogenase 1
MLPLWFQIAAITWLILALATFGVLLFITVPYGRHTAKGWGPTINNKLAWMLMELPSLVVMTGFLLSGKRAFESYSWILFVLWIVHYANRALFYPLRIRPTQKRMPVVILVCGVFFNVVNAGLNGYYLAELAPPNKYTTAWLSGIPFMAGAALFVCGFTINQVADAMLIRLRKKGDYGYSIPGGFLFDYISSPNLFGEIIEWAGFALMAMNLPALTFAVWTAANLLPRAKNHHDWYRRNFPDYPPKRKAVLPFLF